MIGETLVQVLRARAETQAASPALTFLGRGGEAAEALDYAALDARARAIAAALTPHARPGDRALLLFPPGLDYAAAFLGCLYAGVVAVPVYLPRGPRQLPRLAAIVADATPAVALTTRDVLGSGGAGLAAVLTGRVALAVDDLPAGLAAEWRGAGPRPDDLAFLQYTSGSTGAPRGVMVRHGNLMHNAALTYKAFGHDPDSLALLWVPPYHDMGLIGGIIQPLYGGFPGVLMSPTAFLKHPLGWLRAVSKWGATTSGGPDFAYALCAARAKPEDLEDLDLSRWRVAFNGAEPVRAATLDRFAAVFAPAGFRREAFVPCYGLAEATLLVSAGPARRVDLDAAALARHRVEPGAMPLVASGPVADGLEVRIVAPETGVPCGPGEVGEIQVAGASVAAGYWNRPDAGFGDWLSTGDLGCFVDGDLLVTGRLKDLIIVDGRNVYPQDLEASAGAAHPALQAGAGAAFALAGEDSERVGLVHEVGRHAPHGEVVSAIRAAIAADHDVALAEVVLVPVGGLPRTSSGKVRRAATRDALAAGTLPALVPVPVP